MFIGHFAVAFAAKKYVPAVSLGILFLACQLADIIWPNLVLSGIEEVTVEPGNTVLTPLNFVYYPWSHGLITLALWSLLLALIYSVLSKAGTRAAVVIAIAGVSHWILDFLTHRPDMPLGPEQSRLVGLGLWNFPLLALPLEIALFALGLWLYLSTTRARNHRGSIGLWALVTFLILIYLASLLGPPPPSVHAVAWSAQALWLLVFWGFWVDRNRESIS